MFGSKKLQEATAQMDALRRELEREKKARTDAERELSSVRGQISDLEKQLADSDLDTLKEKARETIAEYEGLKDLYNRKISEFEEGREEKEQAFAREAALQRHSLENEIHDNRVANQEFVAKTVKTFSESYNYYLNQIKTLMDALGNVAARTGNALFDAENADLKEHFGLQMVEELKNGLDGMQNDAGDRILIGAAEAAMDQVEECCEKAEEAEACEEEACCCQEVPQEEDQETVEKNADEIADDVIEEAADFAE